MLDSLLEDELLELKARDLYRRLRALERTGPVTARLEGREILLFCGNDYLGLSHHPRVIQAAQEAAARCGAGSGAARLISGTAPLHAELETRLAASKKKARALVFSSGYLGNLGVLAALAGKKDLMVMDKLCHASLIDGARLSGAALRVFPHKNYGRCEAVLKAGSSAARRILVTDSLFSMDGDLADLNELVRLKEKYECLLVVDDAHGTGVLGLRGGGAAEDLGLEDRIDVITGTLSKALGCLGGFAAASETVIDYFVNRSRPFIFATSLPPMLCAAALEAMRVIETCPEIRRALWGNVRKIHDGLRRLGFDPGPLCSPIFPIMIGEEKEAVRISEALLKEGILMPAVRAPAVPKGKARLRLTASACHHSEDLDRLFAVLKKALQDSSRHPPWRRGRDSNPGTPCGVT